MTDAKRLYVLVNNRLNSVYGCVQGGHAVAQYMIETPKQSWDNEYLIYLWANVDSWHRKLMNLGVHHVIFREPDLNNSITAIACRDDSGELFKNLKTVK